jgi:V8-like Glu-specific endopeptidase
MTVSAVVALGAASCGSSPAEPWATQREAIIDGTEDPGDPAVVYIIIDSGDGHFAAATGAVVSPHVVLTAGHVLSVFDAPSFRIFAGPNRKDAGENPNWMYVGEAHADPAFNPKIGTSGHDVSVLILRAPTAIAPLKMNRTPATLSWIGNTVRTVGYGIDSITDVLAESAGVRRQATTTITAVNSTTFSSALGGEQPCGGDSGGPAFMNIDGAEVIAGVVSNGDSTCNGVSFARVDASAAFVDQWIAQFDPASDADAGSDASPTETGEDAGPGGAEEDAAVDPGSSEDPVGEPPNGDVCAMRGRGGRPWAWTSTALAVAFARVIRRRPRPRQL